MSEGWLDLSPVLAPAVRAKLPQSWKNKLLFQCGITVVGDPDGSWRARVGDTGVRGPTRELVTDQVLEILNLRPDLWPRWDGWPSGLPRWGREVRARGPLDPALEKAIRAFKQIGRVDAGPEFIFAFLRDAAAAGRTAYDVLVSVGLEPPPNPSWEEAIHELDEILSWLYRGGEPPTTTP
jgi:hypothetical protein